MNKHVQKKIRRGDIFMVNCGSGSGSEQSGTRPAIIVSNNIGNVYSPVVEVVYLTTKKKTNLPTHVNIMSAPQPSLALCEQITTVSANRLENKVGACTPKEVLHIDTAIAVSLGLTKA